LLLRNLQIFCSSEISRGSQWTASGASPTDGCGCEEIARRCGVSVSTASRALTGAAGVREQLRSQIVAAARNLSYAIPDLGGRPKGHHGRQQRRHGRQLARQFTFHVLDGLNEKARILGVELVTRPVASREDELATCCVMPKLIRLVAGCLFLTLEDDMLPLTEGFSKPIVLINGDDPSMRHSSVTPCNRAAAQCCRKISHRAWPPPHPVCHAARPAHH
jgi:DNA-binding LacI/PurR family transcriptional regulator